MEYTKGNAIDYFFEKVDAKEMGFSILKNWIHIFIECLHFLLDNRRNPIF